jgi:hypothetical protein
VPGVFLNACLVSVLVQGRSKVAKKVIRLFIRTRKQGSYIASVPLERLGKLSECSAKYRRWSFEDGWLILEAS